MKNNFKTLRKISDWILKYGGWRRLSRIQENFWEGHHTFSETIPYIVEWWDGGDFIGASIWWGIGEDYTLLEIYYDAEELKEFGIKID